jgi:hypothetical protein
MPTTVFLVKLCELCEFTNSHTYSQQYFLFFTDMDGKQRQKLL